MSTTGQWLLLGLRTDRTFAHAVAQFRKDGVDSRVVSIEALLAVYLKNGGDWEKTLPLLRRRLESVGRVYHRLQDISNAFASSAVRTAARKLHEKVMDLLGTDAPWTVVNRPRAEQTNFSKVVHLEWFAAMARQYGIRIPRTVVTNDAAFARTWIATQRCQVVTKGASSVKSICRLLEGHELDRWSTSGSLNTPIMLQHYIQGPDLRVHTIGDHTVGELIASRAVDYRFAHAGDVTAHEVVVVPEAIHKFCVSVNRAEGLHLSGTDFKISLDGAFYFLEMNSMPAFKGYDVRSGGAISRAMLTI
jgi:hypothetical protein